MNTKELIVEKILSGDATDSTKEFSFIVTIRGGNNGNGPAGSYTIGNTTTEFRYENGTATLSFPLKGGEQAEFKVKKAGVSFTVTEQSADQDGYETTINVSNGVTLEGKTASGTIGRNTAVTVAYTNTQNKTSAEATKAWKSGEQTITWPEDVESVEFTLYKTVNGEESEVVADDLTYYLADTDAFVNPIPVTSSTTGHKAVWSNLPTRIMDGDTWYDVTYTAKETKVTYTTEAKAADTNLVDLTTEEAIAAAYGTPRYDSTSHTITNELPTVDISATKQWQDKDGNVLTGTSILANAVVTFTLLADGTATSHTVEVNGVDETSGGTVEKTGDYEGADWTAYFTGLPKYTNNGELIAYTVQETGTWDGYAVAGGVDTVSTGGIIVNKQKSIDINILKVDKNTNTALSGAKFQLKQYDEGYHQVLKTWDEAEVSSEAATKGTLKIEELTVGFYELVETESPAGYVKTSANPRFEVTVNETTKELEVSFADNTGGIVTYNSASNTFTVKNEAGVALPSTGGPGTNLIYLLGMILTAIGCCGIVMRRKRRAG